MISRFKSQVWTVAVCGEAAECQTLSFSYGVQAIHLEKEPSDWREFTGNWFREHEVPARLAILVAGPSPQNPEANYRFEFLRFAERNP
jgi:hypothetical protein